MAVVLNCVAGQKPQPRIRNMAHEVTAPKIKHRPGVIHIKHVRDIHFNLGKCLEYTQGLKLNRKARKQNRRKLRVIPAHEERKKVAEKTEEGHWRHVLVEALHSKKVQTFLTILLVLDVSIVAVDLFLEAEFPSCLQIIRNAVSCCPLPGNGTLDNTHRRWLSGGDQACPDGQWLADETKVYCDPHKHPEVHITHLVLGVTSLVILLIFFVELFLLMIAIGLKAFARNWLYVVDLIVVTVSIVFEVLVLSGSAAYEVLGLLITVRVWRFVRVGHGIITTVSDASQEQAHKMEHDLKELLGNVEKLLKQMGGDAHAVVTRENIESLLPKSPTHHQDKDKLHSVDAGKAKPHGDDADDAKPHSDDVDTAEHIEICMSGSVDLDNADEVEVCV